MGAAESEAVRLFLKRVEMQGFKSFADKIEMQFDGGVTGIVGPNGSGKSNVSDAVRWVLGEQSAKQLRGGTMTDIIFSGTEKRRPLQFCEVSLVFDNADHALQSDYEEIMVTRRVYRNGEGEYFLNKTACRLRDIVDLFRDTGIGKEGYSIIGQGRIDEILSAKSEDRRAIFEEAAGIVKFKARKTEAERRLEHTVANLTRVEDITSELERSLAPLKAQSETARKYLALSQELKTLELSAFAMQYHGYHQKIDALEKQLALLEQAAQECARQQQADQQAFSALEAAIAQDDALLAQHRETLLTLTRQSEAAAGQVQLLTAQLDGIGQERERALKQRQDALAQRELLKNTDSADLKQRQRVVIATCQQALNQITGQLEALQRTLSEKETALEQQSEQMIAAMNRLSDVKSAQTRMSTMKENLQARLSQLDQTPQADLRTHQTQIDQAEQNAQHAHQTLAQLKIQLNQAQEKQQALRDQLTGAFAVQEKVMGASREIGSRLKLLKQMKHDFEGYNQSVKEVLRLCASGRSQADVRGVVADLLRVPKQIERAVEMALGAQAQHIVCASEQDAKTMIEYLRQNRYGRATFLPIATVRGRTLGANEREALTMPGCLGLASEMIAYDDVYQGIAESLLGRTVIAENLDSGIVIMRRFRQSFRLVTLEGDVMNPGGAISGGSVHSRASSLFSREREILELEQAQAKMTGKLQEAEKQIGQITDLREQTRAQIGALSAQIQQQEIACARDAERLENARAQQRQAGEAQKRLEAERTQILGALEDVASALARIEQDSGSGDADREKAQAAIAQLNAQVGDLRVQAETLQETQSARRMALSQAQHELELLERDETHAQNETARLTAAAQQASDALETLSLRQEQQQQALVEAQALSRGLDDQLDVCKQQLALAELERVKKVQRQRGVSDSLERLRIAAQEQSEKQHRAELSLTRISGDLKVHCDRIWEDYQLTYAGAVDYLTPAFVLEDGLKRIDAIRRTIRAMGSINVGAIDEYRASSARFEELSSQKADLTRAMEDLKQIIGELEDKMRTQFTAQFALLGENFAQTFRELFGGGQAQLRLADENDPLNSGIEIIAQPPGKKLQLMSLLSGGERALTAIAILFAILRQKPSPFCILDEIDAALDEANVDNFARFLADFSKETQFIVVTHRKGTMECCNSLYGIAMEEKGVSKIVSVRLRDLTDAQQTA